MLILYEVESQVYFVGKWTEYVRLPSPSHAHLVLESFNPDMSPNSAMCERVFSLLEAMFGQFGQDRNASLSDMLQGSLMLRYNKRLLGCMSSRA
ncbi:hypothetical protein AB1Y20_022102 [Prymnesium parvum]|uniref:Uncharacterized protein n=1 Tax=Prymnesium parvum TaxID=97485 RepID=A0AB34JI05_PRYPA